MGDKKMDEDEAVGMRYCGLGMGGWVGGWVEEEEEVHGAALEGVVHHLERTEEEPVCLGGWVGGWVG